MRLFITLTLLFITTCCLSQQKSVFLLKNDGEYVHSSDSADYIRVVSQPDSGSNLYNVSEFYKNGSRKLIGKSSSIKPLIFEGPCITYFENGNRESNKNYSRNCDINDEFDFYPNGKPYLQKRYLGANPKNLQNYLIIAENDSIGNALIINGNGCYIGYDKEFKNIYEKGKIKDGLRDSIWAGYDLSLEIKFKETYINGNLISGISVGKNGDTVKYDKFRKTEAHYRGIPSAFSAFLVSHFRCQDHSNYGEVTINFTTEKDGALSNFKVINHVSTEIDQAFINAVMQSNKWIPGTMYGRTIEETHNLSFNLVQGN